MAMLEWLQENYGLLLQVLGGFIGVGTAITGFFSGEKATGAKAILLKAANILSVVSPIEVRGSLSVPLTSINIGSKEPVE
jgi:hypothetical protein